MNFLSIEIGNTVVNTGVFDEMGNTLTIETISSQLEYYEKDMNELWDLIKGAIRKITEKASLQSIKSIGLSGLTTGCCPVDWSRNPVGGGIPSIDSRASKIVEKWKNGCSKKYKMFKKSCNSFSDVWNSLENLGV